MNFKLNKMKLSKTLSILLFFFVTILVAQTEEENTPTSEDAEAAALAKATQNPLAAMYSLPFQNNTTFNVGPDDRSHNVLNIQPVIPVSLTDGLNLINRVIIPVVSQPYGGGNGDSSTGVGDISYTAWLSPTKASAITWGFGPAFQIPTASDPDEFGSHEFGVGPSLVALTILDKWVAGVVINNVWTFGDVSDNKFLFQYFVNYNLPNAVYLVSAPIMTADWKSPRGNQWVVPFGGGIGKVFKMGKQPININAQGYYNAVKPDGWGDYQMRIQVQFLFPIKKK